MTDMLHFMKFGCKFATCQLKDLMARRKLPSKIAFLMLHICLSIRKYAFCMLILPHSSQLQFAFHSFP